MVEELARLTGNLDMVRVHVDDQMDSKSLLGAYVCTSNPEEFVWQPGPLTQASFCISRFQGLQCRQVAMVVQELQQDSLWHQNLEDMF